MEQNELLRRIEAAEEELKKLRSFATIPFEVAEAFQSRLKIDNKLQSSGNGTATTQNINLTGNPQVIVVPAQPSGTLVVIVDGISYELLYK